MATIDTYAYRVYTIVCGYVVESRCLWGWRLQGPGGARAMAWNPTPATTPLMMGGGSIGWPSVRQGTADEYLERPPHVDWCSSSSPSAPSLNGGVCFQSSRQNGEMKYLNAQEYSSDGVAHSEVRRMCEEQKQKEKKRIGRERGRGRGREIKWKKERNKIGKDKRENVRVKEEEKERKIEKIKSNEKNKRKQAAEKEKEKGRGKE